MLIETQVVRSKSELLKELQGLPVTKAVIYRNVDRKAWEQWPAAGSVDRYLS